IQIAKNVVRTSLISLLVLSIAFFGSFYYFSQEHFQLLSEQAELNDLRRETKIQKIQVEKFSQQVKNFETEMSRLARFEKKLRIITALENSPKSIEKNWGVGGSYGLTPYSFDNSLEKEAKAMVERLSVDINQLGSQAKLQVISFQELDEFFKNQESFLSATPSIWPTRGWVTSRFGYRKSPFTSLREKHEGLDIAARFGAPIRAPADGVVVVAGREYGFGNLVQIDHGYGLVTRYGHNSKHVVEVGDRVKRGQVIAYVGSTGRSTGPHVHYEVMLHGVSVNPQNYILEE
ncbi:MAG: peptidoglycan DD-metalloendopeptidase family protein, partial [Nitrospinales bacterium]